MLKCGLLGRKLGHSISPTIHGMLGDYSYELFEREEEDVEAFIKEKEYDGLNVTIPYKKKVMEYLDEISPAAKAIGAVNTVVKRADGTLFGDNTDAPGFAGLLKYFGASPKNKKCLVLGSGGAGVCIKYVLESLGANVVVISRNGQDNYGNLEKHYDASYIVNTTPVGMFPDVDASPLDPAPFCKCEGVIDIIYNPAQTKLMKQALDAGIKSINGLYMLVAQAAVASEKFTGKKLKDGIIEEIFERLKDR